MTVSVSSTLAQSSPELGQTPQQHYSRFQALLGQKRLLRRHGLCVSTAHIRCSFGWESGSEIPKATAGLRLVQRVLKVATMTNDGRDILELLKGELDFIENGGYGRSVRTPWKPKSAFQDSLTCITMPTHTERTLVTNAICSISSALSTIVQRCPVITFR